MWILWVTIINFLFFAFCLGSLVAVIFTVCWLADETKSVAFYIVHLFSPSSCSISFLLIDSSFSLSLFSFSRQEAFLWKLMNLCCSWNNVDRFSQFMKIQFTNLLPTLFSFFLLFREHSTFACKFGREEKIVWEIDSDDTRISREHIRKFSKNYFSRYISTTAAEWSARSPLVPADELFTHESERKEKDNNYSRQKTSHTYSRVLDIA